MDIKICIDEKKVQEMVEYEITRNAMSKNEYRYDMKKAIGAGIKEFIYNNKEQIIEKVVDRAAKEIVKKGLPKLLERSGE